MAGGAEGPQAERPSHAERRAGEAPRQGQGYLNSETSVRLVKATAKPED